jgi:hypothetical protein
VRKRARERIATLHPRELELSFERLKSDPASVDGAKSERAEALDWLLDVLQQRLQESALEAKDASLAERLLKRDPSLARGNNSALVELASESARPSRILGKTVGLLVNTSSPVTERRSAAVLRGLSRQLRATSQAGIRLSTRQYDGSADSLGVALGHLAADGAGLIVGGVDEHDATEIQKRAFRHGLAHLLLSVPESPPRAATPNVFVLGLSRSEVESALQVALNTHGLGNPLVVEPDLPACDPTRAEAGSGQFPLSEWQSERKVSLLLLTDAACGTQLSEALAKSRYRPALALGLGTTHLAAELSAKLDVFAVRAGRFPSLPKLSTTDGFDHTPPDWFESLGQDAGRLARLALAEFPVGVVTDPTRIGALRADAVDKLARAQVPDMDTSQSGSFTAERRLSRTLSGEFLRSRQGQGH